jgi:hypothetical protein
MVKISGKRLRSKDLPMMSCVTYVSKTYRFINFGWIGSLLILAGLGVDPYTPMLLLDCLNPALNLRRPVIMR